ncbi:hypothetical protein NHX12_017156 [Muraenolepis orangiensis]|uniref:Uncharacterized protein n=1 Tax=Muraenolepis orangiensis TaxID=630683 RepID=A0A9Q0I2D2_9TELE|nr:hypothetical protein NHX12_017156 [Muraenolepis orangiensis]
MCPHLASSDWSSITQETRGSGNQGPERIPQQSVQVVCVLVPGEARPAQLEWLKVWMGWGVRGGTVQLAQCQPEGVRVHLDQVVEHASREKEG